MSVSSAFSKSSLNIWKFSVHVLLKPRLENFKHYFAIVHGFQMSYVQVLEKNNSDDVILNMWKSNMAALLE